MTRGNLTGELKSMKPINASDSRLVAPTNIFAAARTGKLAAASLLPFIEYPQEY